MSIFVPRHPYYGARRGSTAACRGLGGGSKIKCTKDLRNCAEILPNGPLWKNCLQSILHNPLVKDHIQFHPFQLFQSAEGVMRVYTEWLSGNTAWEMQDSLPQGATLLGTILSSDKTNISAMTEKCLRGLLADRLIHECLDFVLQPLKTAASIGTMMSDPLGWRQFCFIPLAAYIINTPESTLIAGVAGRTSLVTMALYKQLGDNFWHEPCTASTTLTQLHVVEEKADPWDLEAYFKAAFTVPSI
ncbi:hypothetical protein BYT27DRAFT_7210979 [Phlegmacium glaucopus]|nr:hypothetical protein BYT27DRAFT_7210979 [Phlegmacium glaucopus]